MATKEYYMRNTKQQEPYLENTMKKWARVKPLTWLACLGVNVIQDLSQFFVDDISSQVKFLFIFVLMNRVTFWFLLRRWRTLKKSLQLGRIQRVAEKMKKKFGTEQKEVAEKWNLATGEKLYIRFDFITLFYF